MSTNNIDDTGFYKTAVFTILDTYTQLGYKPQHTTWTIVASFFLSRQPNIDAGTSGEIKVISLATGTKCLPAARLSTRGEIVHDSHAEVLARRCALRWFLEEIHRVVSPEPFESVWIEKNESGKYCLQKGVEVNLYVSTIPCGDASMRFLASSQDEEMAALKNSSAIPTSEIDPSLASRGRDNYSRLGVLRTKPGRADSPPTFCMSCSDKIARWNVLGIQGALGANFLEPMYLSAIVIGEVPQESREAVKEDCERAFWKRLGDINGLPAGYSIHKTKVHFTDVSFQHSRSVLASPNSCVESFYWISDSKPPGFQIIINGLKRGVAPKHRFRDKSRPLICRLTLMDFYFTIKHEIEGLKPPFVRVKKTYRDLKDQSIHYQEARELVVGPNAPFAGWVPTGAEWQSFDLFGVPGSPEPSSDAETTTS